MPTGRSARRSDLFASHIQVELFDHTVGRTLPDSCRQQTADRVFAFRGHDNDSSNQADSFESGGLTAHGTGPPGKFDGLMHLFIDMHVADLSRETSQGAIELVELRAPIYPDLSIAPGSRRRDTARSVLIERTASAAMIR
jgi:hypothetical protein